MPYGTLNGQINLQNIQVQTVQTTTSTTLVSAGSGITIGASYTGRFLILISCGVSNNTVNDGVSVSIFRVAGGAVPSAGSATTGTELSNSRSNSVSATANAIGATAIMAIDSPGIGTFTYYAAFAAITGGTASIMPGSTSLMITVVEL